MIAVIETKADLDYRPKSIVSRAWNFRRANILHSDLLEHHKRPPTIATTREYAKDWAYRERTLWNDILECDPFLPNELLPRGYRGKKVWNRRLNTLKKVAPLIKRAVQETSTNL